MPFPPHTKIISTSAAARVKKPRPTEIRNEETAASTEVKYPAAIIFTPENKKERLKTLSTRTDTV